MTFGKHVPEKDKFLRLFTARAEQLANEVAGGGVETFAAFELLVSILSAYQGGLMEDDLTPAYPVKNWRENQVSIPIALLKSILLPWTEFAVQDQKLTMEQVFGLAASTRGGSSVLKNELKKKRDRHLSNLVVIDILESEAAGQPISQDSACASVSEWEGVKPRIVERAFHEYGRDTLKKFRSGGH